LDVLVPYIDWTPFLELGIVWEISSDFTDDVVGEQATLFLRCQEMLKLF
jgi:hypothetical protein